MIHMYTKFDYDTFVRFSVMAKNVLFIKEHRGATLRSPYDVIQPYDVITIKNTFSWIIWDDVLIFAAKLKWPPFWCQNQVLSRG